MVPDRHGQRGPRRKAREKALQLLFQIDVTGEEPAAAAASYWAANPSGEEAHAYAQRLVDLVVAHRADIDAILGRAVEHWSLDRMSAVDRNLLRLAICELRYVDDVPPKVTLNEAIEIAKNYSTPESSRFVNGVLDHVLAEMEANAK